MATKKVNYTKEQIATLIAGYDMEASVEERGKQVKVLAVELKRKPASIIAKLSNLNHYVAKTYTTKTGDESIRKGAIVALIASAVGETEEAFDTLSKANKTVLESLWNFVQPEEVVENDSQTEKSDAETA